MGKYLQTEFNKYHENIKLHDKDENKDLRDKRDMLTDEMRAYFKKKSEEEKSTKITFSVENQGSYSMGTGILPVKKGDFDIDVMVLFNISKDDFKPVEVKQWVHDALSRSNRTVEYKKPCVTVQYLNNGEPEFHVDLALYADDNSNGKTYISKGKPTSASADKVWEVSNPKLLKEKINTRFSDAEDRSQMKRIIRYLKRWKDLKFKDSGNEKPTGIALTALAYNLFSPVIERRSFDSTIEPDDLSALTKLVTAIKGEFNWFSNEISVQLPVEPYNDLFEKMSTKQCEKFKEKIETLESALEDANNEPDPHEASKTIRKILGDDFPLVEKKDTGQKRNLAFPGKSESA